MPGLPGLDRSQITFSSLEDAISTDNEVRFMDAFVDKLDLKKLGIKSLCQTEKQKAGRASFEDGLFLKLYLYGYLNGIRSSRRLEKEINEIYANTKQDPSIQSSIYSQIHLRENAPSPVSLNTGLQKPPSLMIRGFRFLKYLSFMVGLFQSA